MKLLWCMNVLYARANHVYNMWILSICQQSYLKFRLNFNSILHGRRYPRLATSCLKGKSRIVLWLSSWIWMIKQALANKETVWCCIWSWLERKVRFGIIKQLLNSTSSNIRLVLLGQVMLGSASLRPTSLVMAKQIWCWTQSHPTTV